MLHGHTTEHHDPAPADSAPQESALVLLTRGLFGAEPEQVTPAEEGLAAAVYAVVVQGRSIMIKLYRDPARAAWFEELVPLLRRLADVDIPVPTLLYHGRLGKGWSYLVYDRIPGVPLSKYAGERDPIWEEIGELASRVNRLPAPGCGRPSAGDRRITSDWCAFAGREIEQMMDALRGTEALRQRDAMLPLGKLIERIEVRLGDLCAWQFDPKIIHANLSERNVIVDAESGVVRALIDWDSVLYARAPHAELATALLWLPESSAHRFLVGYGLSTPAYEAIERDVATMRLLALSRYLHWHLLHGNDALVEAILYQMAVILGEESIGEA